MKQLLPIVLGHEAKKSQKGPTEGVKTGVAIVWIPPHFQALKSIWALPAGEIRSLINSNHYFSL